MEPRADQRPAAPRAPWPSRVAHLPRDHLPSPLQPRQGRPEQGAHQETANGQAAAQTAPTSGERSVRFVAPGKLIAHRPPVVASRMRVGDWEGDLIMGRNGRSAIGTLVERHSRYVVLPHLPDGHSSPALRDALSSMPEQPRRSLTWDQGSEMARHDEVAHLLSDGVYFAAPAVPPRDISRAGPLVGRPMPGRLRSTSEGCRSPFQAG